MDAFVDEVCDRLEITDGEIRRATKYSQVELIRNVFDHSGSKPTVCAQLITGAHGRPKHGSVQVAVADAGVGLLGSFGSLHPWVETDSIAIETALEPHISSTFLPGERAPDGANNAGLGLHFVSELVKRSDGRMLVWSGSHALAIIGDETMKEGFRYSTANAHRLPGTLVVVEYEVGTIHDYATVVEDLRDETSALYELTSDKEVVEIDTRPTTAVIRETRIHALLREDTSKARSYREQYLLPRIRRGDVEYSLSFQGYDALSPSFAHALLYAPIRAAALGDQKIYVRDASPGVWSSIKRVERYCLGTRLNQ